MGRKSPAERSPRSSADREEIAGDQRLACRFGHGEWKSELWPSEFASRAFAAAFDLRRNETRPRQSGVLPVASATVSGSLNGGLRNSPAERSLRSSADREEIAADRRLA